MDQPTQHSIDQRRRRSDQERLESWKAIAKYLNRSVRTVRRWEANENLPVHRHQHTKGSSVYAYKEELDAWRDQNNASLPKESLPTPPTPPTPPVEPSRTPRSRTTIGYAAIAVLAMLIGGVIAATLRNSQPRLDPPIVSNDTWVLITAPENYSQHDQMGDNLQAALRREISRTGMYRVLPRVRAERVLERMRLDTATHLSPTIARQIAMRDGRVGALLVPRIEQLGDSFVLSVEIVDPASDRLISYPSQRVKDLQSILPALERLSASVNEELGNATIDRTRPQLPLVTTSSMSALRFYARAHGLLLDDRPTAARELLGLALKDDPEFASAMVLQAWAMRRDGVDAEQYLPIAKTAADLNRGTAAQERYFIEGSYRHFLGDLTRADADYRALLDVQADHVLGSQAMLELCNATSPAVECVEHKVRVARLRPQHLESNIDAAWALAADADDTDAAMYFADRARALVEEKAGDFTPDSVTRTLVFPVLAAWTHGDVEGALQESRRIRAGLYALPTTTQSSMLKQLAIFSLMLGRVNDAKLLLAELPDTPERQELYASVLFASGDQAGLREHLESGDEYRDMGTALLMAMVGMSDQAMDLQRRLQDSRSGVARGAVIRARIAIGDDRPDRARPELETAVAQLTPDDRGFYFVGPDLLSMLLKSEGDIVAAVKMLETTAPRRNSAAYRDSGLFWMMCQRHLATLYREADRDSDAARIEDQLRGLLMFADDDFPLLKSLNDA